MRSSKSRSRGNKNRNNRPPSGGNIINRVFDSSGPEGKVRGTPQQIIEKYNQLHRDAQLSGDRVNSENFAQHAEHYTRLLGEAQKEIDRQREEQEAQNRERQAERDRQIERDRERQQRLRAQEEAGQQAAPHEAAADPAPADPRSDSRPPRRNRDRRDDGRDDGRGGAYDPGSSDQPDVDLGISSVGFLQTDEGDSGLVETPEEQQAADSPKRAPRARKPRTPKEAGGAGPAEAAE